MQMMLMSICADRSILLHFVNVFFDKFLLHTRLGFYSRPVARIFQRGVTWTCISTIIIYMRAQKCKTRGV